MMSKPVVVPLDGSAFAEQALSFAVSIVRRTAAPLHLVRIRPTLPLGLDGTEEGEYLQQVAERVRAQGAGPIVARVIHDEFGPLDHDPPGPEQVAGLIADYATARGAGLIIMTTHGRGGLARMWLGSVADSLVRSATQPVLLIRPTDDEAAVARVDPEFSHVMVPLDGTDACEDAIPVAVEIGGPFGARYSMVRVASSLTWAAAPTSEAAPMVYAPPLSDKAVEEYLNRAALPLQKKGMKVETHVLFGNSPAPALIDFAADNAVDLIVLATAARSGVPRLLLGSIADKLVRAAPVPVLVCSRRR
jgi:nucleotide-binding universal stress UspA family protein